MDHCSECAAASRRPSAKINRTYKNFGKFDLVSVTWWLVHACEFEGRKEKSIRGQDLRTREGKLERS